MKALFRLIAAVLCTAALAGSAFALDVPALTGRVVDNAKVLTEPQRREIESLSKAIEDKSTAQVVVLIVKSLAGDTPEDFSQRVFEKWKPGLKEGPNKDKGLLIFLAIEERKVRLHTGYGLEGVIPDAEAWHIIRKVIAPHLKGKKGGTDNYHVALRDTMLHVGKLIAGEIEPTKSTPGASKKDEGKLLLFLIPIVIAAFAAMAHPLAGGAVGGLGSGIVGWFLFGATGAGIALAVGFLIGLVANFLLDLIINVGLGGGGDGVFGGGGGSSGGGGATGDF
ncbi:MAG: TPM domain-containing protein [Patescibacteria group bacterium]